MNFTVVPVGDSLAYLTVWPTGESRPLVSTLNNLTGTIVANAAIVPAGDGGQISVYPSDDTQLVVDINGYFAAPGPNGIVTLSCGALPGVRFAQDRQRTAVQRDTDASGRCSEQRMRRAQHGASLCLQRDGCPGGKL